jgi:hypothetical protein
MEKIYEFENGTIHVMIPETCDRDNLRKVTEDFLKKVMYGGSKNGNSNSCRNFRKK